ncbi:MAG: hypothetical protein K0M60_07055 [Hydrogenophaga sp.]|nr:hypothetical protein [Hydrogenophaga sp.]
MSAKEETQALQNRSGRSENLIALRRLLLRQTRPCLGPWGTAGRPLWQTRQRLLPSGSDVGSRKSGRPVTGNHDVGQHRNLAATCAAPMILVVAAYPIRSEA